MRKFLFRSMCTSKVCKGCSLDLPLGHYYKHKRMLDGHLNYCVDCVKARVNKHRAENLERFHAYDRARSVLPTRKNQLAQLASRSITDPLRRRAHTMTGNAIRDGKLIRPSTCSQCGKSCKPEAHHDDYSKPLDVRWLCRSCHCRFHRLQSISLQYPLADAS
jgi:hypothetical protein